jgi:hypothetical protein
MVGDLRCDTVLIDGLCALDFNSWGIGVTVRLTLDGISHMLFGLPITVRSGFCSSGRRWLF